MQFLKKSHPAIAKPSLVLRLPLVSHVFLKNAQWGHYLGRCNVWRSSHCEDGFHTVMTAKHFISISTSGFFWGLRIYKLTRNSWTRQILKMSIAMTTGKENASEFTVLWTPFSSPSLSLVPQIGTKNMVQLKNSIFTQNFWGDEVLFWSLGVKTEKVWFWQTPTWNFFLFDGHQLKYFPGRGLLAQGYRVGNIIHPKLGNHLWEFTRMYVPFYCGQNFENHIVFVW